MGYLKAYGCEAISSVIFYDDGTYQTILTDAKTEEVLNTTSGTWDMSFFEVTARRIGQNGSTPYTYNPFTNILKNGPSDVANIYKKVH